MIGEMIMSTQELHHNILYQWVVKETLLWQEKEIRRVCMYEGNIYINAYIRERIFFFWK